MKIYTRGGDYGETSLLGGGRVRKDHQRIEAYGTVDELNSSIGVVLANLSQHTLSRPLQQIQHDLFEIGSQLASAVSDIRFPGVHPVRIGDLESAIDAMEKQLEPLKNFILPGGGASAAHLHMSRCICRRAERLVVALPDIDEPMHTTIAYLNRLSDYLFVAARFANHEQGVTDVLWSRA